MTEPFIGEIQIFGFNFAPYQWLLCNGATLAISQNTALYALIGTYYGGNGTTTYQLPNLVNRAPCSQGGSPGLSLRTIGETFGEGTVGLTSNEMPQHTHQMRVYGGGTKAASPLPNASLSNTSPFEVFVHSPAPSTTLSPSTITPAGSSTPHDNNQPYLALTFAIAAYGNYPAFN